MKKLFGLLVMTMLVFTLSACGLFGGEELPPEVVDCLENPDAPECQVDCLVNPDDPSCEEPPVDCNVTPDDPECEEPPVDCNVTPDDPECDEPPIECDPGYVLVGENCILIDNKTPEQILAEAIQANWDGSMDHIDTLLDTMDFTNGMEMMTEFNLQVTDDDNQIHIANVTVTDTFTYGPYTIVHRVIEADIDGEQVEFELYLEEVETGVRVYFNTAFLRSVLLTPDMDPDGEIQDVLNTLDANNEWFMFKFDDSLESVVELAVLKEMLESLIVQELGVNFFYELQDEVEMETGIDLSTHGVDLGQWVDYVFEDDWTNLETSLNNVDVQGIIHEIDMEKLTPEVIDEITMYETELLAYAALDVDVTFVLADEVAYLTLNGTESWLNQLTDPEVEMYLEVMIDPEAAELFRQYRAGTLDHYLVMMAFDDPDFYNGLMEIPGLDVAALENAFDVLDYDAFYMEAADLTGLPVVIYEGQASFDQYITNLAMTSPQTASLLAPFSGTVLFLQDYKMYIDDAIYAFEGLVIFEQYTTPDYYFDNDLLILSMNVTPDFEIETIATLDHSETTQLFTDLTGDIWEYLDGFETFDVPYVQYVNCPAGADCMPFEEYAEILSALNQLGDTVVTMTYDPSNPDMMMTEVQFASFLNSVMLQAGGSGSIDDASITLTMKEFGGETVPQTDITDVNMRAEEFAKFSLTLIAADYLRDLEEFYMINPMELPESTVTLPFTEFEPYLNFSMAFDPEMSEFTITVDDTDPSNPVYGYFINLYWVDETRVFTENLSHDALDMIVGDNTGAPSRADYLMYIGKVDMANFHLTKLMLVFLWDNQDDDWYYGWDMSIEDLYRYDGTDGNPAFVAYEGWIYDVSMVVAWRDGHYEQYGAYLGQDVTLALRDAGMTDILMNLPVVGQIWYHSFHQITYGDLALFDGSIPHFPVLVAYNDNIYDVTWDPEWQSGHYDQYGAYKGTDVTQALDDALIGDVPFMGIDPVGHIWHPDWIYIYDTEIGMYDGTDGNPMYVVYEGHIYDVTNVTGWINGDYETYGMYPGGDISEQVWSNNLDINVVLDSQPIIGMLYWHCNCYTREDLRDYYNGTIQCM